jgi:hypothetical protein
MIKLMLLITILAGLLIYHWDKVPKRVKTSLQGAKTMSVEVIDNGAEMPDSMKNFVNNKLIPKVKKFLE